MKNEDISFLQIRETSQKGEVLLQLSDRSLQMSKKDAELVVRAVNSHEALLEAAKEAIWAIGRVAALHGVIDDEVQETIEKLNTTIREAEGLL